MRRRPQLRGKSNDKSISRILPRRLAGIQERMLQACARCGRDPAGVRLVAVSKTVEPERIRQALACGVTLLGENYIQEAREKIPIIDNREISWHYIGHLQTNKAKYAAALFDMVHSLDSLPLAQALDREAGKRGTGAAGFGAGECFRRAEQKRLRARRCARADCSSSWPAASARAGPYDHAAACG